MRDKLLIKLARFQTTHPGRMLGIAAVITVILAIFCTQLSVTMRWSDLLPANDIRTLEFNQIIKEFKTATSFTIVVQGETAKIKEFADVLAPRLKNVEVTVKDSIKPVIGRVEYKTDQAFLKKNGLLLVKAADLKNLQDIYFDPNISGLITNINNSLEKEYVGKAESISNREKEDGAVRFLDGLENLLQTITNTAESGTISSGTAAAAVDRLLLGEPYLISYDKSTLILNAVPTFDVTNIGLVVSGTEELQKVLDKTLKDFPTVQAGLTGMMPISHDEMVYSEQSLGYTTLIAVIAILILLILTFRMWVAPLLAMGNLLIGLIWAVGLTAIFVGQLNIMTQMMSVILLGLGIDFSIHLISGFTERRAAGDSIHTALQETYLKSGKGIITGAFTTAFAFLSLIISSSRGMKEMGLVTAMGLLAVLATTFIVLPVFLIYRERRYDRRQKNRQPTQRDISFKFLGKTAAKLAKHRRLTLISALIITIALGYAASKITFDQNYMNIEPAGLTSISLQDTVLAKFDMSMDYALVTAMSVEESRQIAQTYRKMGSIAMTEDISVYLPSEQQQKKRRIYINKIRETLAAVKIRTSINPSEMKNIIKELQRLEMNLIEMQDMAFLGGQDKVESKCQSLVGDPDKPQIPGLTSRMMAILEKNILQSAQNLGKFQNMFSPGFKQTILDMCSATKLSFEDLPESITNRYCNAKRDRFLITVFPTGSIWQDASFLHRFADDLESVTDRATGLPPVFRALIEVIGKDGRIAMGLTVIIVFLLLLADFRKIKYALIAMIPLAAGIVWMVGLMKLTGQQFTVLNVMGLPMIIGIGIDDGVHVVHRWLAEGKTNIFLVFASTGKAILLTTLTTMLAFGSLIFSIWRGFGQLGGALFVGVAACFLTTVLILAGLFGKDKAPTRVPHS